VIDRRLLYVALAVAALVGLFVVVRPNEDGAGAGATTARPPTLEPAPTARTDSEPTATTEPEVTRWRVDTRDDRLDRLSVPRGTTVRLVVIADVTDHVHVHGYDLMQDVAPGAPAVIQFSASVPGRFEIELEDRGREIAQLTVEP
jgi:hypothetical protein